MMKNLLIGVGLLQATLLFGYQEKPEQMQWLENKVTACEKGNDESCRFLYDYITKFFPMLCGNQGKRKHDSSHPEGSNRFYWTAFTANQHATCKILADALTSEAFIRALSLRAK